MLAQHRILSVGTDAKLLSTRQTLLSSRGYDTRIATLDDVEETLRCGAFDVAILSATLSDEEQRRAMSQLPVGTRPLVLKTLVWPDELLRMTPINAAFGTAQTST